MTAETTVEWGVCPVCGAWVMGPLLEDLTLYTAAVEHCPPPGAAKPDHTRLIISGIRH
ncbi:hypothetical protein ACFVVU_23765 [Kitasatospora sp. NPDC057965]|uniref:hypothetical protein n=1 Tax=Kitasatospora sp. NPDC057965 TaxID=3346291 RepID=UPI0036D90B89